MVQFTSILFPIQAVRSITLRVQGRHHASIATKSAEWGYSGGKDDGKRGERHTMAIQENRMGEIEES